MALWGIKEQKTSTGTIQITVASAGDKVGTCTGASTLFTTQAKVGNIIRAGSPSLDYVILAIASNTSCTVAMGKNGAAVTTQAALTAYSLVEKPTFVAHESSDSGVVGNTNKAGASGDTNKVWMLDTTEYNTNTINSTTTQASTSTGITSGSPNVTLGASNTAIQVGMTVTGTGIAAGTTVSSISGTALVLSKNATISAGGTPVTLTFYYPTINSKGLHTGWVRRTVGTGGRAGRIHYETLVAMGQPASATGDYATDDTIIGNP